MGCCGKSRKPTKAITKLVPPPQKKRGQCYYIPDPIEKDKVICGACGDMRDASLMPIRRNCPVRDSNPSDGPGTRLKRWLATLGLKSCERCNSLAAEMDRRGPEWCRTHLDDTLVPKVMENVAAMNVISQETLKGRAALTGLKMLPEAMRREAVRKEILSKGIESYENSQNSTR